MSDTRWDDPREHDERDRGDEWLRVYDARDQDPHDPRDGDSIEPPQRHHFSTTGHRPRVLMKEW